MWMVNEESAKTELLPANPRRATVAAVNANVRMDMFFILIIVKIRREHIGCYGVCTPYLIEPEIGR